MNKGKPGQPRAGTAVDRGGRASAWYNVSLMTTRAPAIQLGEVTISSVVEIGRSSYPTASMLPDSTPEAVAAHHAWLKPHFFDDVKLLVGVPVGALAAMGVVLMVQERGRRPWGSDSCPERQH